MSFAKVPSIIRRHNDANLHNLGDTNSDFTSWTEDPDEALHWAEIDGPGGRILIDDVNLQEAINEGHIVFPDIDRFDESEILRRSEIEGLRSVPIDEFLDDVE